MQGFAALMLSAAIAASSPMARQVLHPVEAPTAPVAEAYVAELDADWNVSREIRVPCPSESGCAVDLGIGDAGLKAVHVRFDPLRSGTVEVTSRLEDASGRASAARGETLAVDHSGFGASHYEVDAAAPGADGRIILVAVRVPGWTAPGGPVSPASADRT